MTVYTAHLTRMTQAEEKALRRERATLLMQQGDI
jgi:hypothetical protein